MMTERRFPASWRSTRLPGGWEVTDATGVVLVRVYGDDRPKGGADERLTVDEARRLTAGIRRLPELLGK